MELLLRKKRQRRGITDWMSPCAEQLTADVINGAMDPTSSSCCGNTEMQPLLNDKQPRSRECAACALPPSPYSDQDDTEYVLMQMQKSRESLARSQKKFDESLHCVDPSVSQTKCNLTAPPEKKN
ncbi:hypothetical protein O0L34_g8105 [Tuta absoluta]|nr:hypothetical protein O0L34_g8105 [Tuta absoluta]